MVGLGVSSVATSPCTCTVSRFFINNSFSSLIQRHQIHSWDMTNKSVSFKLHKGLYGTELPKGTVIEVEIDTELEGEVCVCAIMCATFFFF